MSEDIFPAPRNNPHLEGQEAAERTLKDAADSGTLAHAWLIAGPRGIGKATLAYRFARYLLAGSGANENTGPGLFGDLPEDGASGDGLFISPETPVFRRVAAGGHADLLTIERQRTDAGKLRSEIVVGDVRGIGSFLSMTAGEGGWRVVVIDGADHMNRSAANAVLKVLEEPPARAVLLLVCHNPGRLLATVRSRCRTLTLPPLANALVEDLLTRYHPELSADAPDLARLAEGSIGRAAALADAGGVELYRELRGHLSGLPQLDWEALHKLGDKMARNGAEETFRTAADLIIWWLAGLIRFAAAPGQAGGGEDELYARLHAAAGLERWLQVWEKVNHMLARADSLHLDRKQVILNTFLTFEDAVRS